jgi:CRP-like cAMP-binding protein
MTSKKHRVALLGSVPLFSDLSQRDLGRIWDQMTIVEHPAGHRVVDEGTGGRGFHLILSGEAVVERKRTRVRLAPGDFFGEIALIDDGPRTASVTAVGPLVTATLSSWQFKSIVQKRSDLAWKMLVHMTGRLRAEQSISSSLTS